MSDTMLLGVLRMPYGMAMGSKLSQLQYHSRGQEAADRIEQLERASHAMQIQLSLREIQIRRLADQLAAEKALADRLYNCITLDGHVEDDALQARAAYRKARGL